MIAGIGLAVKAMRPDVTVVGVQAEAAAAYPPSLAAGRPVALDRMATMADGIAVGRPGDLPFAHVRDLVDEVVTVSEAAISKALLLCLERAKLVVEPAGAAAVAAVLAEPRRWEPPMVAVLTGGNIDPLLLMRVIQHGMLAAGRYLSVRVRIADRPGSWPRCSCWWPSWARTWSTSSTPGPRRTSTWARWRSRSRWRPAAPSTGSSCWPR